MDTSEASGGREADEDAGVSAGPVAADRPVVDGTTASPEQLRAEVAREQDLDQRRVEELRAEVAETAEELSARLDVPARVRAKGEQAAVRLRTARDTALEHPGPLAAGAALLALLVIVRRRRSGGRGRP